MNTLLEKEMIVTEQGKLAPKGNKHCILWLATAYNQHKGATFSPKTMNALVRDNNNRGTFAIKYWASGKRGINALQVMDMNHP